MMMQNNLKLTSEQEHLIELMRKKVEQKMKGYIEDFYRYDLRYIKQAIEDGLKDFLWFLSDSGTHFIEEYQHAEQQEYLKNIEEVEGMSLKNGHSILFVCDLETGKMKKVQSFEEVYEK